MCNLFGGIVFVALLVALLAGDGASKKVNETLHPTEDLLRREIANLQADREVLSKSIESERKKIESSKDSGALADQQAILDLKNELKALKEALKMTIENTPEGQDLGEFLKKIKERKVGLENESVSLENKSKSLKEEKERLVKRLADLEERGKKIASERTQDFRFPREKPTAKKRLWIIVHYDSFYPVFDLRGSGSLRLDLVDVTELPGKTVIKAIRGQGLKSGQDFSDWLGGLNVSEMFPVFVVYPDSFSKYKTIRDIALKNKIEYGSTFEEEGEPLILVTEGGSRPGVQ
jgi:hypothetical protein